MKFSYLFVLLQLTFLLSCSGGSRNNPHEPESRDLRKIADPSETRKFVQSCAANVTLGWETSAGNKYWTDGYYGGTSVPMQLKGNGDSVTLATALTLHYPEADSPTKEGLRKRLDETKPCLVEFFSKHGITLELTFYNENETGAPSESSTQINLRLYGERPITLNMRNWAFGSDGAIDRPGYTCTLIVHEFSHLLGLSDEYADEKVPNRFIGEDDSLMKTLSTDPAQVKFYPRHIKTLFKPMCP
jgi:hypothetical protein